MKNPTERYCIDMVALKHLMGFEDVPMSSCSLRLKTDNGEEILPGNAMFVLIVPKQDKG